jgi:hypothetical protein
MSIDDLAHSGQFAPTDFPSGIHESLESLDQREIYWARRADAVMFTVMLEVKVPDVVPVKRAPK